MSKVKTTYMKEQEYKEAIEEEGFRPPAGWMIFNAFNDVIWIHCRNRSDAQKWVNEEFGHNKYLVKAVRTGKKPDKVTAK